MSNTTAVYKNEISSAESSSEQQQESQKELVHSIMFNQDNTCIALSTSLGYRIFSIDSRNRKDKSRNIVDLLQSAAVLSKNGVLITKMLYCTSLLALVYAKNPRLLSIEDVSMNNMRCEKVFTSNIVRVDLNRVRVVVLTADGILHVFDLASMRLLNSVAVVPSTQARRVFKNPISGDPGRFFILSCLTNTAAHNWLVCRNVECAGAIIVFNAMNMKMENMTKAHVHEITSMAVGSSEVIASGNEAREILVTTGKGTIIRVWSLPDCSPLYSLRRGLNSCIIYSLALNPRGDLLAVSSSSGTIHIFSLADVKVSVDAHQKSSVSSSGPKISQSKSLMKIRLKKSNLNDSSKNNFPRNTLAFISPPGGNDALIVTDISAKLQAYSLANFQNPKIFAAEDLVTLFKTRSSTQKVSVLDM